MLPLTLLLIVAAVSLSAQPVGRGMEERWRRDDRNGDGRVERSEFSGPATLFERLDRDRDGAISAAEIRNARPTADGTARTPRVPADVELTQGVVFGTVAGRDLTLDLLRPKASTDRPRPLVVFIHGGAWRAGNSSGGVQRLLPLVQKGFIGASITYRLTPEAIFPAQIHDAKCAIRFLRAQAAHYGIDPARIGVWGSSAGGHLVALLGTAAEATALEGEGGSAQASSAVQAVCDWFGPSDLLSIADQPSQMNHAAADSPESLLIGGILKDHSEQARAASPITYVSGNEPPFLIMHGTKDMTVPFQQSVILTDALKRAGCDVTFVPIEGAGHGGPPFETAAVQEQVMGFFLRVLGSPAR